MGVADKPCECECEAGKLTPVEHREKKIIEDSCWMVDTVPMETRPEETAQQ